MKKVLLLLCFLIAILPAIGQTHCASDILQENKRAKSPLFGEAEQRFNTKISSPERRMANSTPDTEIRIPVVVHIVHKGEAIGSGSNISYSQVVSQIDALNAAFSNYSDLPNYLQAGVGTAYNIPERRGLHGVDTKVRFCLAPNLGTISPNGQQIAGQPGVIRYNNETLSRHDMAFSGQEALMDLTHPTAETLPANLFFNIWVVSAIRNGGPINSGDIPGIAGYAPIPVDYPYANDWPLRGVVVRHDMFGDNTVNGNNFALYTNFTEGKVFIHEVGHALGLYHTFHTYSQNSSSPCDLDYGDLIADTPPCSMNNLGLYYSGQPIRNTCTNDNPDANDMLENFMYYSEDEIRNTFTDGQKERMRAVIEEVYAEMVGDQNLIASGIIGASGCYGPILSADFSLIQNGCVNQPVIASGIENPNNLATSWSWTVIPATSIDNPNAATTSILFTIPGVYTVSLTATGVQGLETISKTIVISPCVLNECAVKNGNTHIVVGNGVHLDFSSGMPVAKTDAFFPGGFNSVEANFTQSDENGNLLFYTDGHWVWNSQHQKMNAGNPLSMASPTNPNQIIAQSTHQIIGTPFPGHPGQYVIFLPPASEENAVFAPGKFKYAIVDLVNASVSGPVTIETGPDPTLIQENVAVVPHCNGRDYWVMIVKSGSPTVIKNYLFSAAGLKLVTAYQLQNFGGFNTTVFWGTCHIEASRDGSRLLVGLRDLIKVIDFDNATGAFSNERSMIKNDPDATYYEYEPHFSASGNKLFMKCNTKIKVYDVSDTAITLTNPNLYTTQSSTYYVKLFMGPDDNIYFPDLVGISCGFSNSKKLTKIENPDSANPIVIPDYIALNPADANCQSIRFSVPNPIDACTPDRLDPNFTIEKISCNQVRVFLVGCFREYHVTINWGDSTPAAFGTYTAVFGNPPTHTYATPGNYTITLSVSITAGMGDTNSDGILDLHTVTLPSVTQTVSILDATVPIIGSTSVCPGSQPVQYLLNGGLNGNYIWSVSGSGNSIVGTSSGIGSNSVNVNWQTDGTVSVAYSENSCTYSKQLDVAYVCPDLGVGNPDMQQLEYHPNPVNGLLSIKFDGGITKVTVFNVLGQLILEKGYNASSVSVDFSGFQSGNYFVKVESGASQKVIKIIKQ